MDPGDVATESGREEEGVGRRPVPALTPSPDHPGTSGDTANTGNLGLGGIGTVETVLQMRSR